MTVTALSGCGPSCYSYAYPVILIYFSQMDALPALRGPVSYKVCDDLCLKQGSCDLEKEIPQVL